MTARVGLKSRIRDRCTLVHLVWIATILVIALAARILWVIYAPADPFDGRGWDDTYFYHNSACLFAEGRGYRAHFGQITAMWPPGYTFLLGTLYWLFGASVTIGWIANIILGALTSAAVYILGNLVLGQRVGAVSGLLLAVFPGHVFFSSLLLSEIPFTLLVVIAMILILVIGRQEENAGILRIILLGIVIGAASLVRGQGLMLPLIAGIFWWLHTANWKRSLRWTALVGLTCVAVISPWTIRNYVTMNRFVFLSTNVGYNLYTGNYENADGGYQHNTTDWINRMFAHLPTQEREVAVGNAAFREGLKFMLTHPQKEAQLAVSKLYRLYKDDVEALEMIDAPLVGKRLKYYDVLAYIGNKYYFAVLATALIGLLFWVRRPRSAVALPLAVIVLVTLGQLLFFTIRRFHFPLLPSFCLLSAVGLVSGVERVRSWVKIIQRRTES